MSFHVIADFFDLWHRLLELIIIDSQLTHKSHELYINGAY